MKTKKAGFWICVIASVLVIGSTLAGWLGIGADNDTEDTTTNETAIVCVDTALV